MIKSRVVSVEVTLPQRCLGMSHPCIGIQSALALASLSKTLPTIVKVPRARFKAMMKSLTGTMSCWIMPQAKCCLGNRFCYNIGVTLRSAMAIEFGAYVATLLRYKTCSSSRCYKVRDFDAVSPWLSFIGVVPSWLVPARPKSACVSRWQNQLRYGIFLLLCLDKNVIV